MSSGSRGSGTTLGDFLVMKPMKGKGKRKRGSSSNAPAPPATPTANENQPEPVQTGSENSKSEQTSNNSSEVSIKVEKSPKVLQSTVEEKGAASKSNKTMNDKGSKRNVKTVNSISKVASKEENEVLGRNDIIANRKKEEISGNDNKSETENPPKNSNSDEVSESNSAKLNENSRQVAENGTDKGKGPSKEKKNRNRKNSEKSNKTQSKSRTNSVSKNDVATSNGVLNEKEKVEDEKSITIKRNAKPVQEELSVNSEVKEVKKSKVEKEDIKSDIKTDISTPKSGSATTVNEMKSTHQAETNNDQGMSRMAALERVAKRASQADQIIAYLHTQIAQLKSDAAVSSCRAEEQTLEAENSKLRREVELLKSQLVQAEAANGVKQIAIPRSGPAPSAPAPQAPAAPVTAGAPKADEKKQQQQQQKKKEKKEKKEGDNKGKQQQQQAAAPVDVSRLDMRVGLIRSAKKHPDADGLYVEEVDLGEETPRTIVSGLVKFVPLEQMQNRLAIFLINLKPVKMRGILSQGMIMCGSSPEVVEIIVPPEGSAIGDRVYVDGYQGTPDAQMNPKKKIFEQVQPDLRINESGLACYRGIPWNVAGKGTCSVPTMRDKIIK